MILENLQHNDLNDATYQWYVGYLRCVDDKDAVAFGSYLAEDCTMHQNNDEPIRGKAAIVTGLAAYWQTFSSLEHELLNIFGSDNAFVLEAWNHYVRLDGDKVSVRAVAITERDVGGLVKYFRFYTDVSPVFTPAGE